MGEKIAIADHKQQAISTEGRHMPKAFSSPPPPPVEIAFKKKKERLRRIGSVTLSFDRFSREFFHFFFF